MFLEQANLKMTHIPYKGPLAAAQDLLAGHVDCSFVVESTVSEFVKTNRLSGIAVSTKVRSNILPDLPTMQESGFREFDVTIYTVIFGVAKVPANVLAKFEAALKEVSNSPEVREAIQQSGLSPVWSSSEFAQQELQRQSQRFGTSLKRLNMSLE
jgi:tripartite-type tricarboxylate transporter receptor subunit TctC